MRSRQRTVRPHPRSALCSRRPEDQGTVRATVAYGTQHILTMYGGVIAPPLIVGGAAGLSRAEMAPAGHRRPLHGRSRHPAADPRVPSFGSAAAPGAGHLVRERLHHGGDRQRGRAARGLRLGHRGRADRAGDPPFFAQLIRFFPPVVTGVDHHLIGLSLLPVAAMWAMGGTGRRPRLGWRTSGSPGSPCDHPGAQPGLCQAISRLSILLAIVLGTVVAAALAWPTSPGRDRPVVAFPTPFALRRADVPRRRRSSR